MIYVIGVLYFACLGDADSFDSQMPPLPDFNHYVDYAEWVNSANIGSHIHIIENHTAKQVKCPEPSESVNAFMKSILDYPRSWDASKHADVFKWVCEVRLSSSKYLSDLPWKVYDPQANYYSCNDPTVLLRPFHLPNERDLELIVIANIMASLEKKEKEPLPLLQEALLYMKDSIEDVDFDSIGTVRDLQHILCKVTFWIIQNRERNLDQVKDWVALLSHVHTRDIRRIYMDSIRLDCAQTLSRIQWLSEVDSGGVNRYDSERMENVIRFFDDSKTCREVMKQKSPIKDAQQCRQLCASFCDAIDKAIEKPGSEDYIVIEDQSTEEPCYERFHPNLWGSTYTYVIQRMEKERRLDCLKLYLLVYQKEHEKWPKSLKELSGVNPVWLKDPKTGKQFQYCVDKKNQPYLVNEAFPGKKDN